MIMCADKVKTLPDGGFSSHYAWKLLMKVIIAIIILFNAKPCSSQDLIILKSGRQMKVSIVEEGDGLVKYREYGVANSPLYSIEKEMISEIKYSGKPSREKEAGRNENKNGEATGRSVPGEDTSGLLTVKKRYVYQGERKISSKNVRLLMEDIPDGLSLYEKGIRDLRISDACPVAIIFLNFAAGQIVNGYDDQSQKMKIAIPTLAIDGGLIVAAIVFASKGKNKIRQSVSLYNSSVKSAAPLSFKTEAGFTGNGIGVKIRF